MTVGNMIGVLLVLLTPIALIYAWVCYFTPADKEPRGWRSRATLFSLALASLAAVLWLEMMIRLPGADWRTGAGVVHQVAWEYARTRAAFGVLLLAFVLSLFGRPRLILPVALACIGTAAFWLFSTMP
jgi:hypothetical protein